MHVIDFQKRGLPNAHILIILSDDDRVLTPDLVNSIPGNGRVPDPGHAGLLLL